MKEGGFADSRRGGGDGKQGQGRTESFNMKSIKSNWSTIVEELGGLCKKMNYVDWSKI